MPNLLKTTALAVAASAVMVTTPIAAAPFSHHLPAAETTYGVPAWQAETSEHGKKRKYRDRYYYDRGRYDSYRYDEPVYRDTRVWEGDDGRFYCRRSNGTTGLLIGGAAGALAGREIAGRGDRTLGALLGGVAGALLGREIDRGGSRCR
ncbi:glycine zipper 2TM domain-containing protein [Parerythrobacter aurantius]|uniref:glycine zipper 2TM domain-containing protein n=1 Tax=Parerythrobacter aurantius TaxID=3127706 RepID=UPI003253051D